MEPHARGGDCSNRPGRPLERTLDGCRFLIGWVENLGDVLPDRLARFRRNFLGKLPQFLVLGGYGLESLVRLRCGQGEDIRHRLAAQEMGEEIDRGGGIGIRDLDDLKPVVGRAPAIARIGLTQRFRHLPRRGLDLLAAFLCAGDALLGKLAEHAGQPDPRESEQRHPETIRSVQSGFHFTFTHGTITFLKRNHFPRRWLASRELVEAESCPLPCSISFWMSFNPARMPLCPTNGVLSVRFPTLDLNFFRRCQYTQSSYTGMVLCITGTSQGAARRCRFFQRHHKVSALARERH